jgi:hypothetical protein
MSYKDLLLVRSKPFEDGASPRAAMDYLALRNHEALLAWRMRRVTGGFHPASRSSRAWLPSWLRPDVARGA